MAFAGIYKYDPCFILWLLLVVLVVVSSHDGVIINEQIVVHTVIHPRPSCGGSTAVFFTFWIVAQFDKFDRIVIVVVVLIIVDNACVGACIIVPGWY